MCTSTDIKTYFGANCTIGLPVIRTAVDHGTAYGKAGEGRANEESMLDAIYAAVTIANNLEEIWRRVKISECSYPM